MSEKLFNDGVYQTIELDSTLMRFIDTPQFQRLRFIKQLGFASYVYPSANHTRFEHSIGTAYLAGELLKHLAKTNKDIFKQVLDKDIQCVKLAGLLHDIGHGPFSHSWELAINKAITDPNHHFVHERVSLSMIDYLIQENPSILGDTDLDDDDIRFVKELIHPEPEEKPSSRWNRKELGFLYQIISNKDTGCDVDKWDYLNRDAHHAGMETSFDYKRLISNAQVVWHGGRTQIGFRDKALQNLLQMFETRKTMHKQVYQHRVVKQIERLFVCAIKMAANDEFKIRSSKCPEAEPLSLLNAVTQMEFFMGLDDSIIQRIYVEGSKEARSFIRRILDRKLGHLMLNSYVDCERLNHDHLESEFSRKLEDMGIGCSVWFNVQRTDFGMKEKHPLANLVFTPKEGKPFCLSKEYLNLITPANIQQHQLVIYVDKESEDSETGFSKTDLRKIEETLREFLDKKEGIRLISKQPAGAKEILGQNIEK